MKHSIEQNKRNQHRAWLLTAAILAMPVVGPSASSAAITFDTASNITGDSNVFALGTGVYAYDWDSSATVNGVSFTGTKSIVGSGDGNIGLAVAGSGVIANSTGYTTGTAPFGSLSSSYKAILIGGDYDNHTPGGDAFTVTLNGITAGHAYATQVWANDPRPKAGRNVTLTSTGGNSVKLTYSATNVAGVPGQYAIGGFVAAGGSQAFTATGGTTTASLNTQLNAIQLRDVTGIWSGSTDGNWDSTTNNFTGPMNYPTVTSLVNTISFADTDGFANPVTQNAITIQAGGVTIGNVVFQNNSVNYTFTGADAVGMTGSGNVLKTGIGQVTLLSSNSYSGGTNVSAGILTGSGPYAFGTGNLIVNPTGATGTGADAATVYSNASIAPTAGVVVNTNSPTAVGTLVLQEQLPQIGSLSGTGVVLLANTSNPVLTIGAGNVDSVFAGTISDIGTGSLLKVGSGNFTFSGSNTYHGYTNVSSGTLTVSGSHALPAGTSLNISAGASVIVANLGSPVAITVSNVSSGGILNLNSNALIVHGGDLTAINTQVAAGYNSGAWNGSSGIESASAANDPNHLTALGAIVNDDGTNTSTPLYGPGSATAAAFDGAAPAPGDILVKYTYYGDTNLDGVVDGSDYSRIDNAYLADQNTPTSLTGWFNGDFNYDRTVDGSDYTLMDNAFNSQGAALSALIANPLAVSTALIAEASSTSSVPEPTAFLMMAFSAAGLLRRRSRRK